MRCVPSCNNICPFCRRHYERIKTYWEIKRDVEITDRNDIEYPSLYDANILSYSSLVDSLNMMDNLLHGTVAQSTVVRRCNKNKCFIGYVHKYYREHVIDNMIYKRQSRATELIQYNVKRHYEHLPRIQQQIISVKLHGIGSTSSGILPTYNH